MRSFEYAIDVVLPKTFSCIIYILYFSGVSGDGDSWISDGFENVSKSYHLILDGLDLLYCRRHLEDECGAKYEGIEVYFRAIILRFQSIRDT